jgi:hypothetical protein
MKLMGRGGKEIAVTNMTSSSPTALRTPPSAADIRGEQPKPEQLNRFHPRPGANDAAAHPTARPRCVDVLARSMAHSAFGF